MPNPRRTTVASVCALIGIVLALVCAVAALLSGLGHRFGWWDYRTGLGILRWSAWGGLAAAGVSLPGLLAKARPRLSAIAGVLLGLAVLAVPWSFQQHRPEGPPIHDITTDLANPPQFVAVLPLRKDAPNTAEYDASAGALQQKAYPDIAPATLALLPNEVFARCLSAAKALGWEIVAAEPAEGRIEATDTTLFFGFKDDIVIRIAPSAGGSRVDVRSVSRVGRSDFGTNANRIRAFLRELAQRS
jgi:uncharacterized protein (DUF1499 family)